MSLITLPNPFPTKFFFLKLELCFHYFYYYAKGDLRKKSFRRVLHIYITVLTIVKKNGICYCYLIKLSFCKYFKDDFQAISTGDKFDCLLISEYNRTFIIFIWRKCLNLPEIRLFLSETLKWLKLVTF